MDRQLKKRGFWQAFTDTLSDIFSFAKSTASAVRKYGDDLYRATQGVAGKAFDAVMTCSAKDYVSEKLGLIRTPAAKSQKRRVTDSWLCITHYVRLDFQSHKHWQLVGTGERMTIAMFGTHIDPAKDKNRCWLPWE